MELLKGPRKKIMNLVDSDSFVTCVFLRNQRQQNTQGSYIILLYEYGILFSYYGILSENSSSRSRGTDFHSIPS